LKDSYRNKTKILKILFLKACGKIIEKVQQSSLNQSSDNLALEESSPSTGSSAFSRKGFITETGKSQGHVQKGIS
jgi:hypothetical protein